MRGFLALGALVLSGLVRSSPTQDRAAQIHAASGWAQWYDPDTWTLWPQCSPEAGEPHPVCFDADATPEDEEFILWEDVYSCAMAPLGSNVITNGDFSNGLEGWEVERIVSRWDYDVWRIPQSMQVNETLFSTEFNLTMHPKWTNAPASYMAVKFHPTQQEISSGRATFKISQNITLPQYNPSWETPDRAIYANGGNYPNEHPYNYPCWQNWVLDWNAFYIDNPFVPNAIEGDARYWWGPIPQMRRQVCTTWVNQWAYSVEQDAWYSAAEPYHPFDAFGPYNWDTYRMISWYPGYENYTALGPFLRNYAHSGIWRATYDTFPEETKARLEISFGCDNMAEEDVSFYIGNLSLKPRVWG